MLQSTIPEAQLLKPLPQSLLKDEDSWPIFSLRDVEIYRTDQGDEATAIEIWRAEPALPVTVEGTLSRLPKALHKYYRNASNPPGESQHVKITDCTLWSYGQYEDGRIAFWVAGKAGWYEVKPAKGYSETHRRMKQAIELLYFIADFYQERLKKLGGGSAAKRKAGMQQISVETLLAEYVAEPKHRCPSGLDGVRARFLEHSEVLLTFMKRGKEEAGWKWPDTPLFKWLVTHTAPESSTSPEMAPSNEDEAASIPTSSASHPRVSGKGRPRLRPKTASNKGLLRARTRSSTVGSDEDVEMTDASPPARSAKRKHELLDSPSRRLSKRLAGISAIPNSPMASSPFRDPSPSQEDANLSDNLPIRLGYRAGDSHPHPSAMQLVAIPLPNYEPTPGTDTWHCPFDGCMTRYYGITTQSGVLDMIREHYAAHAVECQRQLDLVKREERPYLPVGNLVRYIRGVVASEAKRDATTTYTTDETKGATAIVQRY